MADELTEHTRSSLDRDVLPGRVAGWFADAMPGTAVEIGGVTSPSGTGMSSETLLFDAAWTDTDGHHDESLVIRLAPSLDDVPVFPSYDLEGQFRIIELVGRHSAVPVPEMIRYEPDPSYLGAPFFLMGRVEGRVPSDLPPYIMDGWLLEASPVDQRRLQDASVAVLAELHGIDIGTHPIDFLELDVAGDTPLQRHMQSQRSYYEWVRDGRRHPTIDAAFAWLEQRWPADEGPTVISWGDSRIGNIMFDGFDPVAVLDWEMAAPAPQELDIGWMIFMHVFFQDIAEVLELRGIPDLMRPADVVTTYEAASGRTVQNLDWFITYAALRHAIIMTRIKARAVHFGQAEWTDDVDDAIPHRARLEAVLAGTGNW